MWGGNYTYLCKWLRKTRKDNLPTECLSLSLRHQILKNEKDPL